MSGTARGNPPRRIFPRRTAIANTLLERITSCLVLEQVLKPKWLRVLLIHLVSYPPPSLSWLPNHASSYPVLVLLLLPAIFLASDREEREGEREERQGEDDRIDDDGYHVITMLVSAGSVPAIYIYREGERRRSRRGRIEEDALGAVPALPIYFRSKLEEESGGSWKLVPRLSCAVLRMFR